MQPPIDIARLPAVARAVLEQSAPAAARQMAAKGVVPGLRPADALAVVALLGESDDEPIAAAAKATLDDVPAVLLSGALSSSDLAPGLLALLAPKYARDAAAMVKMLAHKSMPLDTVAEVAALASEAVAELVAVNEERLLAHPAIIEKLYMNQATRMSTADRVLELAVRHKLELSGIPAFKEAAAAIGQELVAEASPEPTPDDLLFAETDAIARQLAEAGTFEDTYALDEQTGEEVVERKFVPLYARLGNMSVSQKIRRAMLGNSAERAILVRDSNKLVAAAAVRSPLIQENEVVRISSSRAVGDEVLRIIAMDREWTRSHEIKLNLVLNPRTPFLFASRLIAHLREHELKSIAKSKNVTGAVQKAARQQLERRGKKS